jgi:hypothetical protein
MSQNEDLSAGSRVKLNMNVAKSLYRMLQKSLESRGNIEHRVLMTFAPHWVITGWLTWVTDVVNITGQVIMLEV